jgi:putative methionine-R-sulfoxide reductase with GAF domain
LEIVKSSLKGKTLAESLKAACKILKEGIPYYFWVGFYCPGEKNTLNWVPRRGLQPALG